MSQGPNKLVNDRLHTYYGLRVTATSVIQVLVSYCLD